MSEKLLSIAVPVYNTEAYLRRCLDSVLLPERQDELEVILVNDGSSDASPRILREYRERAPGLFVLLEQENAGHGAAVTAALRRASGRFFRVLDSDDWLDTPGLLRLLDRLPGCGEDLVVTPYSRESARCDSEIEGGYPFLTDGKAYTLGEIDWRDGMDYFTLAASTWRTSLLRRCGLSLPARCSYVDMLYNLWPIPLLERFRFFDIPLYRYWIGRPGQSVEPAVMRRQAAMHGRVLRLLFAYTEEKAGSLGEGQRAYMLLVVRYMLRTHCSLVCGSREARRSLRSLTARLRTEAPTVWRLAADSPYLRWSERLGYLLALLDRRALALLAALYRRLRGQRGAEAGP